MKEKPMDLNRFKACSAAFGAERRRWPTHEHALFDHFARSAEGAAILAEAARTDRFLDMLQPAAPDPQFVRRLEALARPSWRRFAAPVAALAASAAFGFGLGFMQSRGVADSAIAAQLLFGPGSLPEAGL